MADDEVLAQISTQGAADFESIIRDCSFMDFAFHLDFKDGGNRLQAFTESKYKALLDNLTGGNNGTGNSQ